MSLIRIHHHPTRIQLGTFGVCWLLFVGGGGFLMRAKGASPAMVTLVWTIAVIIPAIGWFFPRFMRLVYLGMAYLTFPIGFVMSHLILGTVYYLVITPLGWLLRALGRDPLQRGFDANAGSYWLQRETPADPKRYFRQF